MYSSEITNKFLEDEKVIRDAVAKFRRRGYPHVADALRMELYRNPREHAEIRHEAETLLPFTNEAETVHCRPGECAPGGVEYA